MAQFLRPTEPDGSVVEHSPGACKRTKGPSRNPWSLAPSVLSAGLMSRPDSSATASPRRQERKGREMARIRGEIIIERPVEVAFDYVADQPTNRRPTRRC
jgi:hypothetical protein